MIEKKQIFTVPEAARYCCVDRVTFWRWVKSGNIKAWVTPGGHHRIDREDLEAFVREKGIFSGYPEKNDKKNILIVDDDENIQKALTKSLEAHGFVTEVASDGFNAGLKVMKFEPDLIILDIVMPGMDGFEVCRHVKSNPATTHIKILTLTGYDTEENRKRIMDAGADDILVKPANAEILLARIHNLLNDSRFVTLNIKSAENT